jgi:hypothetical protein
VVLDHCLNEPIVRHTHHETGPPDGVEETFLSATSRHDRTRTNTLASIAAVGATIGPKRKNRTWTSEGTSILRIISSAATEFAV